MILSQYSRFCLPALRCFQMPIACWRPVHTPHRTRALPFSAFRAHARRRGVGCDHQSPPTDGWRPPAGCLPRRPWSANSPSPARQPIPTRRRSLGLRRISIQRLLEGREVVNITEALHPGDKSHSCSDSTSLTVSCRWHSILIRLVHKRRTRRRKPGPSPSRFPPR